MNRGTQQNSILSKKDIFCTKPLVRIDLYLAVYLHLIILNGPIFIVITSFCYKIVNKCQNDIITILDCCPYTTSMPVQPFLGNILHCNPSYRYMDNRNNCILELQCIRNNVLSSKISNENFSFFEMSKKLRQLNSSRSQGPLVIPESRT